MKTNIKLFFLPIIFLLVLIVGINLVNSTYWYGVVPSTYYQFESGLNDSRGLYNLSTTNEFALINFTNKKLGASARTYHSDNQAGDNSTIFNANFSLNPFTMAFWINTTDTVAESCVIANHPQIFGAQPTGTFCLDMTATGLIRLNVPGSNFATSTISINDGIYHRVVFVRENTGVNGLKLYIDGALNKQDTFNYDIQNGTALYIGGVQLAGTGLKGTLDDVVIFNNTGWSSSQVLADYNGGAGNNVSYSNLLNLNSPPNNYDTFNNSVIFNCSSGDTGGVYNISLYINGIINQTAFNTTFSPVFEGDFQVNNFAYATYNWTCTTHGLANGFSTTNTNNTLNILLFQETGQTYNPTSISGAVENFYLNLSTLAFISSADLVYNGTTYPAQINQLNPTFTYTISNTLTMPIVNSQQNKTFYWRINGGQFNSTVKNQTINVFQVDNCALYTNLLLNYTIYDEDTQTIIPNNNNMSTQVSLNFFNSDFTTPIANISLNTSINNTRICIGNIGSAKYYINVVATYDGGIDYIQKYNHIQKLVVNSSSIPYHIPLYDLLTTRSQEFLVTYKNSNFLVENDVLVDVTRKYISEGVFKSVEVAKTDSQGQTLVHLVLGDVTYTLVFKKNGVVLAVLENQLARCDSIVNGICVISVNAFSSTIPVADFNYVNNLSVTQYLNSQNRIISAVFTGQGTNLVTINVSRFDRFGNNTVCTNSILSSSGTLSCSISSTYGNSTFVSYVYSNGRLSSQATFSFNTSLNDSDNNGNLIILAIIIVITFPLLFIRDVKMIILSVLAGMILIGTLLIINEGSILSQASALVYIIIAGAIVLYKVNQRGERL